MKRSLLALACAAALPLILGSCGGGGGGEGGEQPEQIGVFSGFSNSGNLDWQSAGTGGDGGVGDGGADGDGGVGAGGDFGQFRGAQLCVYLDDGTRLGCALTDNIKGMVTIKPGKAYKGGLLLELRGTPTASYYEEGRDTYLAFPPDRVIRARVPSIERNIGITPFTEAAYRMLTEGSAPESVGSTTRPTAAQIRAANEKVRGMLNEQFPSALHVDDITRLPFIKLQGLAPGSIGIDPRGRYGLVNGAFSKQASAHHGDSPAPTLDAVKQFAEDMLDGQLDGRNGTRPASVAGSRTYDPHSFASELAGALAEQAARFGAQAALDSLPKVLNFGNVRYEGYLFDGSISKEGAAFSTVAGWVAGNSRNLTLGQSFNRAPGERALAFFGNNGHGGGFYKIDRPAGPPRIFAIGDNVNGELGLGTRDSTRGTAIELSLSAAMTHAAGGFGHTVIRLANGTVVTWGDNSYGQLGQGVDGTAMPRSLTPRLVNLHLPALAVAATNTASYALLEDGTVWAWGSNNGFALLGNGVRDGVALVPTQVAGLADIVQINARDNDVVVLKRDNTVWHWGSFPADEDALVPGDLTSPYRGGSLAPVQVAGLPAGVRVRKVLTEQGLFAALLSNGHVYQWGVYFDITAQAVLRDLTASRVFALPPVRDMMPGGFVGYGVRPFDRLTSMAIDYSGGMWKVRGRVAERFEPDNPAAQRRPPGVARPDCASCHTFLDQTIEQLRALAPSTAGLPVCQPPASNHTPSGNSLIHAETECIFCHNPSRANYPSLPQPFSGNFPNCSKPDNLPPRTSSNPPLVTNSCTIPAGHLFTPPGTVCASCHNSVIARPLQTLPTPCAQPLSSELPTINATGTITGAFVSPGGAAILNGSTTSARRHELRGTLSGALPTGQSLQVMRNGVVVGTAALNSRAWTFTFGSDAPDGSYGHTVRVVDALGGFGITSNSLAFSVDATAPAVVSTVTGFNDDGLGAVAPGGFASDTTPTVLGTFTGTLGAGEFIQVLRDRVARPTPATVTGNTWSYTEPTALAGATYSYQARAVDAVGNTAATGATAQLTVVTSSLPTATITNATVSGTGSPGKPDGTNVVSGGTIPDTTPTLTITLSAPLQAGYEVIVFRDGSPIGNPLTVCTSPCTFVETGSTATQGSHQYRVQTRAGALNGPLSGIYTLVIDTSAPAQTVTLEHVRSNYAPTSTVAGAVPPDQFIASNFGNTNDSTPIMRVTLNADLGAGESVVFRRGTTQVAALSVTTCGANCYEAALDSNVTIVTALANGTALPASSGGGAFQIMGSATFTARVVDAAGLESGTATASVDVGYFLCSQVRADTTHSLLAGGPHPVAISASVAGTRCSSCHNVASGHPGAGDTPAGFFIAVPSSSPAYWCKRPS